MGAFLLKLKEFLLAALNALLSFLPDSPFDFGAVPPIVRQIMGYVNYFIPIGAMLKIFAAWLTAVTIWYVYSLILRWIKAVE